MLLKNLSGRAVSSAAMLAVGTMATVACGHTTVVAQTRTQSSSSHVWTTSTMPAQLFGDDFRGACKGASVSRATPYSESNATHKVVLFSAYTGDLIEDTMTLPADWMVHFDANANAYAQVDTVACVEVKNRQMIRECTGYQDNDGRPTGNRVELNTATYTVTVHEATTGKALGVTELEGSDDSCPMFVTFQDDHQVKTYDVPPSKDQLIAFLKPFVQP